MFVFQSACLNTLDSFQDIVPISLYLTIEGVRLCQAIFIYFDKDICYEKTGQPTIPRTYNLSDDLGQIEYIFSDKTGTLTQVQIHGFVTDCHL